MSADRPIAPSWTELVRANHRNTLGLVAATSGTCLGIQRGESRLVTGRRFRPIHPTALPRLALGDSWFLGVLLCPGDSTNELVAWARTLSRPRLARIRFYFVDGTRLAATLSGWNEAGLPDVPTFKVDDFASFHKLFGRHHADVVYQDAMRAAHRDDTA